MGLAQSRSAVSRVSICLGHRDPLDEPNVRKAFIEVSMPLNGSARPHQLRHTNASLLLQDGADHLRESTAWAQGALDHAADLRALLAGFYEGESGGSAERRAPKTPPAALEVATGGGGGGRGRLCSRANLAG